MPELSADSGGILSLAHKTDIEKRNLSCGFITTLTPKLDWPVSTYPNVEPREKLVLERAKEHPKQGQLGLHSPYYNGRQNSTL